MTVGNEGSTITLYAPPLSVFNLLPSINNVGELVICVDNHGCKELEVGAVYTVIEQTNPKFGYIRLDKFKDYPRMWFSRSRFKKCKATYDGREYTLRLNMQETPCTSS